MIKTISKWYSKNFGNTESVKVLESSKLSSLYSQTDLIRVTVGTRSPVLQVSSPVLGALPGYPDAAASVGHTCAEVVDTRGLVGPSQPPLVVLPLMRVIGLDVSNVMPGQFIYGSLKTVSVLIYILQFVQTSISIIPLSSLIFFVENFV